MKKCPECDHGSSYKLADGRRECRRCGEHFSIRVARESSQWRALIKNRLVEMFVLGVPVYWQCFRQATSSAAGECFYPVLRTCRAYD